MTKELYVILDTVSNEFGEVLSFESFEEAKRAFAWSVHLSPIPYRNDLQLIKVGIISNESNTSGLGELDDCKFIDPTIYSPDDEDMPNWRSSILSTDSEILSQVKKFDDDEAEKNVFMQQLAKNCKDVFSAQDFVNNVSKLSRFMSKDKRFKRL